MTASYPIPDAVQVSALLGMLFDRLSVKPSTKREFKGNYCAVYVNNSSEPVALCVCDLSFAAYCGSALSMLPPSAAKEAIGAATLTPVMMGNFKEVMNICTRLLLRDDTPHLRLEHVVAVGELTTSAAQLLGGAKKRADFSVTLDKFGVGLFTVLY